MTELHTRLAKARLEVNLAENAMGRALYALDQLREVLDEEPSEPKPSPEPTPKPAPEPTPEPTPETFPAIPTSPDSFTIERAPIAKGGGFATTLDIARDGSFMIVDTDVHNGYIRDRGGDTWRLLLRQNNTPRELFDPKTIDSAPSSDSTWSTVIGADNKTILTAWHGVLLRSDNKDEQFVRTCLPQKIMRGGKGYMRTFGHAMAAHPTDPNRWIVGTTNDGCYLSHDGFREHYTELELPQLPIDYRGDPTKHLVAWSKDGEPLVHCQGSGLFRFDANLKPEMIGGPEWASRLVVDQEGTIYVCARREGIRDGYKDAIWRYRAGEWYQIPNSRTASTMAVDPFDPSHIVLAHENGGWAHTYDGGENIVWCSDERGQGESAWLSNVRKADFPSTVAFDPVEQGLVIMSEGVGVCWFTAPAEGEKTITFHDINEGIYELLGTTGISVPGQALNILGTWDKGAQFVSDDELVRWSYCPHEGDEVSYSQVAHLRGIDYALDDKDYLVGVFQQGGGPGKSEDFGVTWTPFPIPEGRDTWTPGGDCAVSTRGNFIIVPANNGEAVGSKDGGETFFPIMLDGKTQLARQINAYYVQRDCVAADKTRPGTFAVLVNNDFPGRNPDGSWIQNPNAGLWVNRNGGEGPWEHTFKGLIDAEPGKAHSAQFWQAKLTYIDGKPGEMLYSALAAHARPADNLVWLKDDGREAIDLPVDKLRGFDLGKAAPGQDYPSLWFWGEYEDVLGWYVSFDWFATPPVFLGRWPLDTISSAGDGMVADKNVFGRGYLSINGNGWAEARL